MRTSRFNKQVTTLRKTSQRAGPAVPTLDDLLPSVPREPDPEADVPFDPGGCCRCGCDKAWIEKGWECWCRTSVHLLEDEFEAMNAGATTILRVACGDFILGFQGSLSANEMKYHISDKLSVTADRLTLSTGDGAILLGERPWDFEKLTKLSQAPVGFTLREDTYVDILVTIALDVHQRATYKVHMPFTCRKCGETPWTFPNMGEFTPRCFCGYWVAIVEGTPIIVDANAKMPRPPPPYQ